MRAEATTDILGRRMRRATGLLILARVALVLGLASRSRAPAAALAHSIVSIYLHGRGRLDGRHGADPSDADQCHSAPARWGLGASALPPFSTPSHAARRTLPDSSNIGDFNRAARTSSIARAEATPIGRCAALLWSFRRT